MDGVRNLLRVAKKHEQKNNITELGGEDLGGLNMQKRKLIIPLMKPTFCGLKSC